MTMREFSVYDSASGQILRTGLSDPVALPHQVAAPSEAIFEEAGNPDVDFVDLGLLAIVGRPGLSDVPPAKTLAVDEDWPISGIPDGTAVWIDGTPAGVVDATGLVLSFPRAGVWRVRLEPPFPWKIAECEVTVS